MSGIDLVGVGQLRQPLEGAEQPLGSLQRVDREIGPRRVAHEQRVAGEDEPFADDEAAVLRSMPRRVYDAHAHRAVVQGLAVLERLEWILGLGERMDRDREAVLEREAAVPGNVIGMGVGLQHACDPHTVVRRRVEVRLDRVCGVDHDGLSARRVADQVGGTAEIVVDELAEQHGREASTVSR
jgi:hypothetical protein